MVDNNVIDFAEYKKKREEEDEAKWEKEIIKKVIKESEELDW